MSQFYNFEATLLTGERYSFNQLRGKVVLIVNTASNCGFVNQFIGLEELYQKYEDLVVIGFPCNQFGREEFMDNAMILDFCTQKFDISFPMMEKTLVNGNGSSEIFVWLKNQKPGIMGFKGIKWNFEKFLINREGQVVKRYSSIMSPSLIEGDIARCLEA